MVGFEGKIAFITGAAQGIGRACMDALRKHGATVVGADVRPSADIVACDVTDAARVDQVVRELVAQHARLDLAVNAAGIEGAIARFADAPADDFARVLDVNLAGVFHCMQRELDAMAATGGAIVNVASVAGLAGWQGAAAYTASKHGVVGLTRTAALEYARKNVRVNAVCPGVTQTPMYERLLAANPQLAERTVAANPMRRVARVEEVAAAVLWLLGDDASFVTGVALPVDGGLLAR